MKIGIGIVYRSPRDEDEQGIYRAAAEDALARAVGREVLRAVPPIHRVSPGEPRLPGHLVLPGMDNVAELTCYVFSLEGLKKLLEEAGADEVERDMIMEQLN